MHSRFMTIAAILPLAYFVCRLLLPRRIKTSTSCSKSLRAHGFWIQWRQEEKKRKGEELPARFQGMKQTIKGDKVIVSRVDGMQIEGRIVIRGEAEPYELDIIQEDREGKKKTRKCIFKIVDQKLVLAEGRMKGQPHLKPARTFVQQYRHLL